MNTQPILIVDDDDDDRDFIQDVWKDLSYQNELFFFKNGEDLLSFLDSEKITPFLIISDVNLPRMNGFELKEKLLSLPSTRYSSTPFVFWSSAISDAQVKKAYDLGVNGIFVKENSLDGIKQVLTDIVNYWEKSKAPK